MDFISNSACLDGETLIEMGTNNYFELQEKLFVPYQSFSFTLFATKEGITSNTSVNIMIVDNGTSFPPNFNIITFLLFYLYKKMLDINILDLKVPEFVLSSKVNKNDNIFI